MSPRVSIIIPAYNCEQYIGGAIDNALEQDYPFKEIIVVNDGSTDNTRAVLDSYSDSVLVVDKTNGGPGAARNTGFSVAKGDLVAFMDADDLWLPGKLTAQVNYLAANPKVGVVFHAWVTWEQSADGSFEALEIPADQPAPEVIDQDQSGWLYNKLLLNSIIHTSTVMLRREVIEHVGQFDTSLRNGEDYDYWLRTSWVTQIHKLARVYSAYRIIPWSAARIPRPINYGQKIVNSALVRWGRVGPDGGVTPRYLIRRRLADIAFDFGYNHYNDGAAGIAARAFATCVIHKPSRMRAWAYLMLACLKKLRRCSDLPAAG